MLHVDNFEGVPLDPVPGVVLGAVVAAVLEVSGLHVRGVGVCLRSWSCSPCQVVGGVVVWVLLPLRVWGVPVVVGGRGCGCGVVCVPPYVYI